ncbi:MAG: glycosyltransferase family 2 protein [Terracidiphilus sp.]
MTPLPFVSIIIPCLNEKKYISGCLDSVLAFDYPRDRLEVLVVDGMSEDGTRDILQSYSRAHPFMRIFDNVNKVQNYALNIAIVSARGDVILRLDAHAEYPVNYVSMSVSVLYETGADNVGGIRKTVPRTDTRLANSLAFAVSSRFTAGNAAYRTGAKERRWVDTVYCGCYRKEVFERIGLFNENLPKAEDREFNQRLREAGGKILLDPQIECKYYARTDYAEYCRWMLLIGSWPFLGARLSKRRLLLFRNYVPLAFDVCLVALLTASCWLSVARWLLALFFLMYGTLSVLAAAPLATSKKDPLYLIIAPFVFITTHVLYGVGSFWGIVKPLGHMAAPVAVTPDPVGGAQQQ